MSDSIVIEISDTIPQSIALKLKDIAIYAGNAEENLARMRSEFKKMLNFDPFKDIKEAIKGTNASIKESIQTVKEQVNAFSGASDKLKEMVNASKSVELNNKNLITSINALTQSYNLLGRAVKLVSGYLGLNFLAKTSSSLIDYKARIDAVAGSANGGSVAMERLVKLAKSTYSSFEQTAESFLQNTIALKDLGLTTDQQLTYTEALNNALLVSGMRGQAAESVTTSLNRAMMLGQLTGQGLNTVIANGGEVVEVLAKQLGINANQLLEYGRKGKITTDVIAEAFVSNSGIIAEKAALMPNQINDAITNLQTSIKQYIFNVDSAYKINEKVANSISFISERIPQLVNVFGVLGVSYVSATAYNALFKTGVDSLGNKTLPYAILKIKAFTAALALNPFGALLIGITAVISALTFFSDDIKVTADEFVTLGDVTRIIFEDIKDFAAKSLSIVSDIFNNTMSSMSGNIDIFGENILGVLQSIQAFHKSVTNELIGLVIAFGKTISLIWNNLGATWENVWKGIYNTSLSFMEAMVNAWQVPIRGLVKLIGYLNQDMANSVTRALDDVIISFDHLNFSEEAKNLASEFKAVWSTALNQDYIGMGINAASQYFEGVTQRVRVKKNDEKWIQEGLIDSKTFKGASVMSNDLKQLLNSLNPTRAALENYCESIIMLENAYNKGQISSNDFNYYLALLKNQYKESLNPLNAYYNEIKRQSDLLDLTAEQRRVEIEFYSVQQDMMAKGIILSEQENALLREKIALKQKKDDATSLQDGLLKNSFGQKVKDHNLFLDALNEVAKSEKWEKSDIVLALNNDSNSLFYGMFEGTGELINAQIAQFEYMYNQIDILTEKFGLNQETAGALRAQVWAAQQNLILNQANSFFGGLAEMQYSNNKKMAMIGKAAAISQAIINTYQSATAAYASMAGIPYVGPALGAAAAAAAIAAGIANVQQIRSQQVGFMNGGYTGNIGISEIAGVVHGREFV
ncbi:tape measure protein, partial [Gilliamella sp. B2887]